MPETSFIPNGDNTIELNRIGDNPNYACVDDPIGVPDDDTTYVYYALAATKRDLYDIPNHTTETGVITNVRVYIRCKSLDGYTSDKFYCGIKTGGTEFYGSENSAGDSNYHDYYYDWNTNPSTSGEWTWDEIDALLIGVKMTRADSLVRCTQVYAVVSYVIPLTVSLDDTITISDSLVKEFEKTLIDSTTISENIELSSEKILSESLSISDELIAMGSFSFYYMDNDEHINAVFLHKPYHMGFDGSLNFNYSNLNFQSGNFTSYVDGIDDERLVITGYDDRPDVTAVFDEIHTVVDEGYEINLLNTHGAYDGVYIIETFSYRPLGLDVFEYQLVLRYLRELDT